MAYVQTITWNDKHIHTVPDLYVSLEATRIINSPTDDKLNIQIKEFYMHNTTNPSMTQFDYVFKVRVCAKSGDTYLGATQIITINSGQLDTKLPASNKVVLTNFYNNTNFTWDIGNYNLDINLVVEIQCGATLQGSSGNGCHILHDEHGHSTLKWFAVGGDKTFSKYQSASGARLDLSATEHTITSVLSWNNGSVPATANVEIFSKASISNGGSHTFTGLNAYTDYCVYYTISDGVTNLTGNKFIRTLLPTVWIWVGDKFCKAIPYIYNNNNWNQTIAHVYDNDSFKETTGEQ